MYPLHTSWYGLDTTHQIYPTGLSLKQLLGYFQECGGTILTTSAILTVAHCVHGDATNRWRARVGSTNGNSGGVVHVLRLINNRPNYNRFNYDNDIAVLRISTNIVFNNNVRGASIASSTYNLADNLVVWAVGCGRTVYNGPASEQLRQVQIYTNNNISFIFVVIKYICIK